MRLWKRCEHLFEGEWEAVYLGGYVRRCKRCRHTWQFKLLFDGHVRLFKPKGL